MMRRQHGWHYLLMVVCGLFCRRHKPVIVIAESAQIKYLLCHQIRNEKMNPVTKSAPDNVTNQSGLT